MELSLAGILYLLYQWVSQIRDVTGLQSSDSTYALRKYAKQTDQKQEGNF